METSSPTLSVVTPVLNGERFIDACLASVQRLAQALPGAVEHIIVDGGSTDGTLERAVEAWRSPASPVTLVLEGPDRGQSHAINRGFARATGRWFAWLNADDIYTPTSADLVGRLASADAIDADVVIGRCEFVSESGRVVFAPKPPDLSSVADLLRPLSRWFAGRCIVQPEAFIRRDAFAAAGGLDESNHLAMDHDLWLRLMACGARFVPMPILVARQTVHAGQKTVNNLEVARQILANCERCVRLCPSELAPELSHELDELRDRLAVAGRVLGTRGGRRPIDRDAVLVSLTRGLDGFRSRRGPLLAIGDAADRAARRAGWRGAAITRARRPIGSDGVFDAVVVDHEAVRFDAACVADAIRSVRVGGLVVVGGAVSRSAPERIRRHIARALGDRVTWAGRPWSGEMLAFARSAVGWAASLRSAGYERSALADVVDRVPVPMAAEHAALLDAFRLAPSDLAETLVLQRGSGVR